MSAVSPLLAQSDAPRILPAPRELHATATEPIGAAYVTVPGKKPEDEFAAEQLRSSFKLRGIPQRANNAVRITLLRADAAEAKRLLADNGLHLDGPMQAEGYVIVADKRGIAVIGDTAAGVFYGVQTLKQMVEGSGANAKVWLGTVRDWPAMKYRGIDDDLSRGPLPTLAFQKHQLEVFSAYKVNVYSPYFENTVQYPGNPLPALPGGAMSPEDVKELVAYAQQLHITIVPEQEAFGHLHHVLEYDKYAEVAETPNGNVLAPGQPGTLPLITNWFTQLAAEFPGPFLHVGADETFDLGTGRTKEDVDKRGLGTVYADFLAQIHQQLEPLHRRLLFWGDVAWSDEAAVQRIPKDMIAVPWVYWHEDNYDKNILPFKKTGIETWVATGDANWSMQYPLGENAMDNIAGFTESGQRLGSTGELVTVWNDDGEGLFNQDWFGVLFGAVAAWQPQSPATAAAEKTAYQDAFGLQFYGDASGRIDEAEKELIAAQKVIDTSDKVFWLDPWTFEGQAALEKMRPNLVSSRQHVERAIELIQMVEQSQPDRAEKDALKAMELGARRIDFTAEKFELAGEMSDAYRKAYALRSDKKHSTEARELLNSIGGMTGRCDDIRNGYTLLKSLYSDAWLAENRPFWLGNVQVRYDVAAQLWHKRSMAMQAIEQEWEKTGQMPAPGTLGVPLIEKHTTDME
ncbi:beta-N-acetylhexosaminidase [Silvibacterium acidisoli]|uniref:beta-N-acetylhexosaminidase n=1 Tax=Acidobacteriaceae bacterium ZG23-2 TaxID=2883246 RepID=UPI00406C3632